jgi:hypothetical protein
MVCSFFCGFHGIPSAVDDEEANLNTSRFIRVTILNILFGFLMFRYEEIVIYRRLLPRSLLARKKKSKIEAALIGDA